MLPVDASNRVTHCIMSFSSSSSCRIQGSHTGKVKRHVQQRRRRTRWERGREREREGERGREREREGERGREREREGERGRERENEGRRGEGRRGEERGGEERRGDTTGTNRLAAGVYEQHADDLAALRAQHLHGRQTLERRAVELNARDDCRVQRDRHIAHAARIVTDAGYSAVYGWTRCMREVAGRGVRGPRETIARYRV